MPDSKDWTWVLDRPCPEFGLDTRLVEPESVADRIRTNSAAWHEVLSTTPEPQRRRAAYTWSTPEYACHVRDVFRLFDQRLGFMLAEDDPLFAKFTTSTTSREPAGLSGEHKNMDTDAEIILRSVVDPRLFAIVYDRHAGTVFRFLIRRVGRDTADELVGEAFRIAFERRATYDVARPSARPWLYGIATHLVAKNRRTEARRLRAMARLASSRPDDSPAENVANVVDARRRWTLVAQGVADLPDAERDALLLYAWEELTYEEIAAALEIPVGTVRSRLNRARRRLRELAAPCGEQGAQGAQGEHGEQGEQPVTVQLARIEQ